MKMNMEAVVETPYYDCFDFKESTGDKNKYVIRVEVDKSERLDFVKDREVVSLPTKDRRKYKQISSYLGYIHVKKDVYRTDGTLLLEEGKCYTNINKHNSFRILEPFANSEDYKVYLKTNTSGFTLPNVSIDEMKYISDKLAEVYKGYTSP